MEPAIHTGALLLAHETPYARLREGDVIVFRQPDGSLNTHRIVALEPEGAITKGDNAFVPDVFPVTPAMYRYRVRYVFNFFANITRAPAAG
jgi:signal peptidase I